MRIVLIVFLFTIIRGECPWKKSRNDDTIAEKTKGSSEAQPPSEVPKLSFIQATFVHKDISDGDRSFSSDMSSLMNEIKQRLHSQFLIEIAYSDADCSKRIDLIDAICSDYPIRSSFHFLVIEDASFGAAVYSPEKQLNAKKERLEMAILDALSRHTTHDLISHSSENARKEIGFVRKITEKEIKAMSRSTSLRKWILRSPFELNLLEPSILELRAFNTPIAWNSLEQLNENTLESAINDNYLSLILYWTDVDNVSQHAFFLWSKASVQIKSRFPEILLGAVSCHLNVNLCLDTVVSKTDRHTIFAYKDGEEIAKTKEMRDEEYYLEWVTMLVSSKMMELKDDEEYKMAKSGKVDLFDNTRPAITIGIFGNKDQDYNEFIEAADILKGKYHLLYHIKDGSSSKVFTIRKNERKKRFDFDGDLNAESIVHFVVESSFPLIVDISKGFTTNVIFGHAQPLLIILSAKSKMKAFIDFCVRNFSYICAKIYSENFDCDEFKAGLQLEKNDKKIILFHMENIFVKNYEEDNDESINEALKDIESSQPTRILEPNEVHPLRFLQLCHVNSIFGKQETALFPEPHLLYAKHSEEADEGEESAGGCPFMAKMNKGHDEL